MPFLGSTTFLFLAISRCTDNGDPNCAFIWTCPLDCHHRTPSDVISIMILHQHLYTTNTLCISLHLCVQSTYQHTILFVYACLCPMHGYYNSTYIHCYHSIAPLGSIIGGIIGGLLALAISTALLVMAIIISVCLCRQKAAVPGMFY